MQKKPRQSRLLQAVRWIAMMHAVDLAMIIRPPRRPPQLQDNAIKGRRFRGIEYNTKAIQNVLKTSHTQYYF